MRIISPTRLQKKKLIEMISKLFPEYKFTRIARNGIVSMSKSFWHLLFIRPKKAHISEICTVLIPERLDKLYYKTFEDSDTPIYHRVYNKYSHLVLELLHHRDKSVIDYLYDEYSHIKYGIRKTYFVKHNVLPEITYTLAEILSNPVKKDGIVLSRLSNFHVKQTLKYWKDFSSTFKHPKLWSKYLNLWFKPEVKEQIRQYYQLRISIA